MRVSARGLTFDVRTAGPDDGEPVLLLHGFPQNATMWGPVSDRLTAAGLRTIAPDQRGYSPGARPVDVEGYRISECAEDVIALLDALALPSAHIVGHDWGAAAAWVAAGRHPDRVRTLTAVSVPHPLALAAALRDSRRQRLRTTYVTLFRREGAAETILTSFNGRVLRWMFTGSGLSDAEVDAYVAPMLHPGALTAALSWYRAIRPGDLTLFPTVARPSTYVWSDGDGAIDRLAARRCGEYVTGPYRFVELTGVSHWIPDQAPDALAEATLERIGAYRSDVAG